MGNVLLHKQIIINANVENPPGKEDIHFMKGWFQDLIESINMKILMGPYMIYSEMIGNEGFTGVAVIETSHIAFHGWNKCDNPFIRLDVYTCSHLNREIILDKLKIFKPHNIEYLVIDRKTELNILEKGML